MADGSRVLVTGYGSRAPSGPGVRDATPAGLALLLAALLAVLLPVGTLDATPAPPALIVNHGARQCSQVIQGDDCSWCEPPAGWAVLGPAGTTSCPQGYARVEAPPMECRLYQIPFCCSRGVHRGFCENMVVNHAAATCAFVANIEGCRLPTSWQSRPAAVESQEWACPSGYTWAAGEVECLAGPAGTPTGTLGSEATQPVPEDEAETRRGICFGLACLVAAALIFGLAAMFPVWYAARQRERRTLPPSPRK
jgi:hypothetical protein